MRALLLLLALSLGPGAAAQSLGWTLIQEGVFGAHTMEPHPDQDRLGTGANAMRTELEEGMAWLRRLGFELPLVDRYEDGNYAATLKNTFSVGESRGTGRNVLAAYRTNRAGSYHALWLRKRSVDSLLVDTQGALLDRRPTGDGEALATAVHEVFHGVQAAYRSPEDGVNGWLWEGTAEAVMHAWMRTQGRTVALRPTDYSAPLLDPSDDGYHREHFWLAVGDLLRAEDQVGYLTHLLAQPDAWGGAAVATVDAGLRAAAEALGAIGPYRGGLYDLFPQVIAQHAPDSTFATVPAVAFGPSAAETLRWEAAPLAAQALRLAIDLDEARLDFRGLPVRLTLSVADDAERLPDGFPAPDGGHPDRERLHLIEGRSVIAPPALPSTPYTHVVTVWSDTTLAVRVANVAPAPADTATVPFRLRVEVGGYYGAEVAADASEDRDLSVRRPSGTDGATSERTGPPPPPPPPVEVAAELPPGFAMSGPAGWSCAGDGRARAVFDLATPDELGRDLDRAVPEAARDAEAMMDDLEVLVDRMERQGRSMGMSREEMARLRAQAEAEMATAMAEVAPEAAAAADQARARATTDLGATFVGAGGCQMGLRATLAGREGGAQEVPMAAADEGATDEVPQFEVLAYPAALLETLRRGAPPTADPYGGWDACAMTERERQDERDRAATGECPPVLCSDGRLTLEAAAQGRIAGTFAFDVLKWPAGDGASRRCRVPEARATVTGHFNVTSTDDGSDDNSLGGIGLGGVMSGAAPVVPGAPILEVGGRD